MKAAKADKQEIEKVQKFYSLVESLWDGRWNSVEDWRDWPDDNKDKQEMLKIEQELIDTEGALVGGQADNRLILYEFFKRRFMEVDYCGSIGRVLMNADVLVNQVCDENLDYLDFNPEIKKALEYYDEMHPEEAEEENDDKGNDADN